MNAGGPDRGARRMQEIVLSCHLDAPVARIWAEVQKPDLLRFVAHPVLRFRPVRPDRFPPRWEGRDYVVSMLWRGCVPLGRQTISITYPDGPDGPEGTKQIRDNGHSALIRRWDHRITLAPEGAGTRYTDHVTIEAGHLTRPVAVFARSFYAHRQRRWRRLVAARFDYAIA